MSRALNLYTLQWCNMSKSGMNYSQIRGNKATLLPSLNAYKMFRFVILYIYNDKLKSY